MKLAVSLLIFAFVLSGCAQTNQDQIAPDLAVPSKYFCEQASDCVEVTLGCCGCSSGGHPEAVNAEWYASYTLPACGADIACTQSYNCFDYETNCVSNKCELKNVGDSPL
ncbi:MAG: hypothetical protein COV47_00395 [Candidatus Diapherotrites archaeon CG11_big_fil_rev_8_21_14_0_20_37_9]|nr:MAG: hypothetical protein COV47_00395 [Candidatus Diapherotrites archaeon CG11_big_fil_rev_8_21_14_0_20_37_9]